MPELSPLIQYGAIGVMTIAVLAGLLLPKWWVDKLLKNKDDQIIDLKSQVQILMKFQEPVIKLVETLNEQVANKRDREG